MAGKERTMNQPTIYGGKTVALVSAMLLCGSMSLAQMRGSSTPAPQNQGQNPNLSSGMNGVPGAAESSSMDQMFIRKAMQDGMAEVQLGQLTLQKSSNDQVKQFAQRMIDDHTKLNDQMKPLAQQLAVDVPAQVSKKDRTTMAKLQELSGPAYDQAYIKDMVKDHKQALSDFQSEASSGKEQAVKNAASDGSRVINQHLQMAQQMAKDQNVAMNGH